MNWDDAKFFLAVARAGQFLGAARRLGVSQAMLSRRIASLESALGVILFERTTKGSMLTDAGVAVMERAKVIEAQFLQMREELSPSGPLSGTLRVGAPDGFGTAYLARNMHRLSQGLPGLKIQLVPVSQSFSLSQRDADLAITVGRPVKGNLLARKLVDYTLGLYASASYVDQNGLPQRWERLAGMTRIGYVEDLVYSESLDFEADLPGSWMPDIEISSAIAQVEAVAAGAGVGLLHDFMVQGRPGLQRVLPDVAVKRSYWQVMHRTQSQGRNVRAFADQLGQMLDADRRVFAPIPAPH